MARRIAVLGSTGSVGENALRIAAAHPDRFEVVALCANSSAERLREQVRSHRPAAACLVAGPLEALDVDASACATFSGADGVLEALERARPDVVLNAITGAAGLPASEWTLRHGRTLALANKESFVAAGEYLMQLAAETGATVLPVDSEHCAIFQCLQGEDRGRIRRIFLTASGGPFRQRPLDSFGAITPAEALEHPTWSMGPRITIGSATMMNKAFEVLEARWLFDLAPEQIEILIHPQSIVHSMVEFVDGSILAQLGVPDMRVPILYCLGWPERVPFPGFQGFDPLRFRELQFHTLDVDRYPAVPLAFDALRMGGDSGAVLNAADEVATGMFLEGGIDFPAITEIVAATLRAHRPAAVRSLDDVHRADRAARQTAERLAADRPRVRSART
ncbi:MAG: 1-deoxy-D-xylulose-5-phosphate reductoisomerase [Planctomycetes bacterium]|nr:1-deoxy-D-xylulose-5-phosphate reductoisomerase [Planctomycetota bacterium]